MPRRSGDTVADIEARHARVVELYNRGVEASAIAEQVGISVTHVFRIRAKVKPAPQRRRPFTDAECAQIESMLADGASYYEVGRTVDRNPTVLRRRWPGYSWTPKEAGEHAVLRERALEQFPGL